MTPRSPYQEALGERLGELHPSLHRYFSAIPEGSVGIGEGVFEEFGTPRRWLWGLLRPFERRGVLLAGHALSVPFRVLNRTVVAGGVGLAIARRELDLPGGRWTMTDSVSSAGRRIVDRIGSPWTVSASFDVGVRDGALTLTSRSVGIVIGRLRVRVPRLFAPVVRLSESSDPASGLQRVELTIDAPVIGRVYGYRGRFEYRIVEEESDDDR